jgi:carbonic anhydrase/acetyltransferase-like protein (isoleucine patch superfamily)
MIKQKTNGTVVIMDGAIVVGDVTLGEDCGIWFNAVVRGDEALQNRRKDKYTGLQRPSLL